MDYRKKSIRFLIALIFTLSVLFSLLLGISYSGESEKILRYDTIAPVGDYEHWSISGTYSENRALSRNFQSGPSGTNVSVLEISAVFNNNSFSEVYAFYSFERPIDVSNYDLFVFDIYVNASTDAETGYSINSNLNYGYGYSLYLFSNSTTYKALSCIPISWVGRNRIAIPVTFTPNYATPAWSDLDSLKQITNIRIDLDSLGPSDQYAHGLSFSSIQVLKADRTSLSNLSASILSVLFIIILFLALSVMTYYVVENAGFRFLKRFEKIVKEILTPISSRKYLLLFIAILISKCTITAVTPLSSDFINIVYGFTPVFPFSNSFANSPASGGIWVTFMSPIFSLWKLFPTDHPEIIAIFPGSYSYPPTVPIFYFLSTPGSFLLVFLAKFPLLLFDVASAFLLYLLVKEIGKSGLVASAAFFAWLMNPFVFLIVEMWGSIDIIMSFFLLLAVFLFVRGKRSLSAISLGMSIGTKLFPILLLPLFLLYSRNSAGGPSQKRLGRWVSSFKFVLLSLLTFLIMVLPNIFLGYNSYGFERTISLNIQMMPDFDFFFGPTAVVFDFRISLIITSFFIFLLLIGFYRLDKSIGFPTSLLIGLLILFSFARWQPQFILWITPFILLDSYIRNRRFLYYAFFAIVLAISLTWFGFYVSTWGHSFFFLPNYTPILQSLSLNLFTFSSSELYKILRLDILLQSLFAAIVMIYIFDILFTKVKSSTWTKIAA